MSVAMTGRNAKTYNEVKDFAVIDGFMEEASRYQFYNTSKYNFELLLADPDNIESHFKNYVAGFSPNIQDVLAIVKAVSNAYSICKEVDNIKHINLILVRKKE